MFVKICGLRDLKELEVVERYADATGVIVECESKRRIDIEKAREIVECSKIPVFLVSTLKDLDGWMRILKEVDSGYVQIHSEVSPDFVEKIRDLGVKVMKAFEVPKFSNDPERDAEILIKKIDSYDLDFILLDSGRGSGLTHDHRISEIVSRHFKIILAGGLNPKNVYEIVEYVKPFGVDVSSGVERYGRKDEELIRDFVKIVRKLNNDQLRCL